MKVPGYLYATFDEMEADAAGDLEEQAKLAAKVGFPPRVSRYPRRGETTRRGGSGQAQDASAKVHVDVVISHPGSR